MRRRARPPTQESEPEPKTPCSASRGITRTDVSRETSRRAWCGRRAPRRSEGGVELALCSSNATAGALLPCACAGSADAKGIGAVCTHSSAQAQPRIISRREARTDFKDPSATFSTSWQASGSKTIFRMIDRLQPVEKLLENPWSALSAASSTCHEVEKVAEKLDFSTRAARAGVWQKDPCHPSTLHVKHPAVVAGGTWRRRDAPKRNAPPQDRRAIR